MSEIDEIKGVNDAVLGITNGGNMFTNFIIKNDLYIEPLKIPDYNGTILEKVNEIIGVLNRLTNTVIK